MDYAFCYCQILLPIFLTPERHVNFLKWLENSGEMWKLLIEIWHWWNTLHFYKTLFLQNIKIWPNGTGRWGAIWDQLDIKVQTKWQEKQFFSLKLLKRICVCVSCRKLGWDYIMCHSMSFSYFVEKKQFPPEISNFQDGHFKLTHVKLHKTYKNTTAWKKFYHR